jgi:CDP-diacylglycerol--glycerol-3-phosphate 3-phosphatidyltransferase
MEKAASVFLTAVSMDEVAVLTAVVFGVMTMFFQGGGMHSLYLIKPGFQALLRPVARGLVRTGLTANQVTALACCLSIQVGLLALVSRPMLLLLPPFFVVRMALNAIDGIMASEFAQKSDLGAYLNELGDVIADSFLYLPFAFQPEFDPLWIGVVIVLSVISEFAGIAAISTGARRRYDGPMGKSDRALVFGVVALWLGAGGSLTVAEARLFPFVIAMLLVVTIVNRVRNGLAESSNDLWRNA